MWIPGLTDAGLAECACAAMVVYGGVANPDHRDGDIPSATLFNRTYKLAARLTPLAEEALWLLDKVCSRIHRSTQQRMASSAPSRISQVMSSAIAIKTRVSAGPTGPTPTL